MNKELLYTIAIDENGNSIHIDNAEKGKNYFCPECEKEFTLKKSDKRLRRAHFAHKQLTTNCTPESYLHSSFKLLLFEKIRDYIQKGLPLDILWKCSYCSKGHNANFLNGISDVKNEYDLKICKPDIALFDVKGEPKAVIEVVVTHEPEENALNYYKNNKIILVKIKLDSLEDLEDVENKIKSSSNVDFCFNMLKQNNVQNKSVNNVIAAYAQYYSEFYKRKELIKRSRKRF